jgi:hypothetical protein
MASSPPTLRFSLHANLVAQRCRGFFAKLTKQRLKQSVFRSVLDLQATINRFVAQTNHDPKPFTWTETQTTSSPRSSVAPSVRFDPLASMMLDLRRRVCYCHFANFTVLTARMNCVGIRLHGRQCRRPEHPTLYFSPKVRLQDAKVLLPCGEV